MTGTIVNAIAIIMGAIIGITVKKIVSKSIIDGVTRMLGVSLVIVSFNGIVTSMVKPVLSEGTLSADGGILLLASLVLGYVLGESLFIDNKINNLGSLIENRLNMQGLVVGFVNASVIMCIGPMSIIGAINEGLYGDHTVLFIKSGLDFITSLIISSSLGIGVLFAFIPILLLQGGISLGACFLSPILNDALINNICTIGFVIIGCIGIKFLGYKKIKTANMLPALLIPIVWHVIRSMV